MTGDDAGVPGGTADGVPGRAGDGVSVGVVDGVASVVLDRPHARNGLDLAMCLGLRAAFERLDSAADVRVVLLRANGPVFCAGADLKERVGRDEAWVRRRRQASFAAYEAIERCSKPVVALVQGPVVGSGGEIAMSCDFVVASTAATFRFPEPHLGTVGATQRLQRVIGRARAKELLFTDRVMSAEEAHRVGLVARLVAPHELADAGVAVAAAIAAAPPLALALTKQAVDLGAETDLDRGIRIEMAAIERNLADGGWRAGVARFSGAGDDVRNDDVRNDAGGTAAPGTGGSTAHGTGDDADSSLGDDADSDSDGSADNGPENSGTTT
ncbi:enoyl-CoA hydratase/isomerase family protein [Saccharothrix australiensis]|uniref:Enoyl-CoA hydratase n=1 Tax=Saccharothrix australiensis TaxID=2072 RepID=A0A495W338_9PSEU|nr:enoyl-CoA hydratase/isomerase family protein [Saccharothrix australiensis]RKT56121.1 enoyl-CoA hydratase [Saccharothrix australiensis]